MTAQHDDIDGAGAPAPAPASAPAPAPASYPAAAGPPYTAVVYVHGMGQQRRHEELSRLLDALDVDANRLSREDPAPRGAPDLRRLRNIKAQVEPPRPAEVGGDDVAYVRLDCDPPGRRHGAGTLYRFYEVYWASITAGGSSVASVARWLASQLRTPLRTLRSPWRERQRLRRAALWRLWRREGFDRRDLGKLAESYDDFEGPEARRGHPEGTFAEFLAFLAAEHAARPETARRLAALARRWRAAYVASEVRNLAVLATSVLAMALLGALSVYYAYQVYAWLWKAWTSAGPPAALADDLKPSLANFLAVLAVLGSALGLSRFARSYLGDVQLWCTYEETDEKHKKREEILAMARSRLVHVLSDDRCGRVVVVAHSLGTAIAMDALLHLGQFNRARNRENPIAGPLPLAKLCCFVTMGSPIDKVHYFFESYRSSYHRYVRVVEALRGDVSTVPFAKNRKPHVHWINFWDRGDVISGSLETPAGVLAADLQVDNVHVSSFHFPDPAASHSGYFDHREVIGRLYDVIFHGAHDLALARKGDPNDPRSPLDYAPLLLGPGTRDARARVYQAGALLLPWSVIAGLALRAAGAGALHRLGGWVLGASAALFAALLAAWLLSRTAGHRAPNRPRGSR